MFFVPKNNNFICLFAHKETHRLNSRTRLPRPKLNLVTKLSSELLLNRPHLMVAVFAYTNETSDNKAISTS